MRPGLLHAVGALCLLGAITCGVAVMRGFAADDYQAALRAVSTANSWKSGEHDPAKCALR
jgi:hypothetical protein